MDNLTYVCEFGDLPQNGHLKQFTINNVKLLVLRDLTGNIKVVSSICPHLGGDLLNGTLNYNNNTIQCNRHKAVLSIDTGETKTPPTITNLSYLNKKIAPVNLPKLNIYKIKIFENRVYIEGEILPQRCAVIF